MRDLDVPILGPTLDVIRKEDRDERLLHSYLYWTPCSYLALSAEYQYENIERDFVPGAVLMTDFEKVDTSKLRDSKIDLELTKILKIKFNQNNFNVISISDPKILPIGEFPKYSMDENLPIQSTIPAFLGLILISFPLGFVLLNNANFNSY